MVHQYLLWAREALASEAAAIGEVSAGLGADFVRTAEAILACRGRVIVMGMGKSGHIGRKIAATLASTGTPAFFVHPAEAAHGDVVVALSNSGESDEILAILPALKRKDTVLIGVSSRSQSSLARFADIHIQAAVSHEACPLNLAPTSSTTAVLALGDALAIVLLKARRFTSEDFALSHPAGSLGRRLLLTVGDLMHSGAELPAVAERTLLKSAIVTMSEKGLGMLAVVDVSGCLKGVLTDGDLRRLFEQRDSFAGLTVNDVMKREPKFIAPDKLASEALRMMQEKRIGGLLVCDEGTHLVGALNMHDLLKARVV